MRRNIALMVVIFLIVPLLVYSATTFIIQETDKISLVPNATDPDKDDLVTYYEPPLNEKGKWQTTYGDAGSYNSKIIVSDGLANASQDILIIVNKKEEPPVIDSYKPRDLFLTITESEVIDFSVTASDLNNDPLSYEWYLDGKKAKEGQEFSYATDYDDEGSHEVKIDVSDGIFTVSKEWKIEVRDFDLQKILDGIPDVTVNENEVATLELPDFEKYGLSYSISEPIGNDNEWKTGYNDAGTYNVDVHAEGNGFSGDTTAKVIVNDVDRAPIFEDIGNRVVNENQLLTIKLKANDPDGGSVTYSADKLPEGAQLNGDIFTWQPSYDVVTKDNFIDYAVEKFTTLSKNFYVRFTAASKDKSVVYNLVITVKDANRAPVIEDIASVTVNEGESINLAPNVYDLDKDRVKVSFSGFIDSNAYKTNYDDAGTHYVTVTASDGYLESSKTVQINIQQTNRVPTFEIIQPIKAAESDNIAILLNAQDPDGDPISYSVENPPDDSSIKDNAFFWIPSYGVASKNKIKKMNIVFAASDGKAAVKQVANLEISDKNRGPFIIEGTKGASVKVNEPVKMFVKASDPDGDKLAYTWEFGLLESYAASEEHQRIFTTPGTKEVMVTVSDGTESVQHPIIVNVEGVPVNKTVKVQKEKEIIKIREKEKEIRFLVPKEKEKKETIEKRELGLQFFEKTFPTDRVKRKGANTPPKIISAPDQVVVEINKEAVISVKAIDDEGDPLTYQWNFGKLGPITRTDSMQKLFTTKGKKQIEVVVSDGTHSVRKPITVFVV